MLWQWVLFLSGSAGLAWLSRESLVRPRSHGFYRFLAWVAMLAVLAQNLPYWFADRFAPHQLLSSAMLFASLGLLFAGLWGLRSTGQPAPTREDEALFGFEKTTRLVTDGVFRYVRHPMYASLLLLAWGVWFKHMTVFGFVCTMLASAFLFLTARREEQECIAYFGAPYRSYMKRSRRFIPFVI